jgi:hypothetical protein
VRTAIGGVFWFTRESQAAAYPRALLRDRALLGDLMLGFEWTRGGLAIQPNLALELGLIELKPKGVSAPIEARASWAALGAGLQLGYRLVRGLRFFAEGLALVPVGPPRFVLQTATSNIELFEPAPVALRLSAGMAYVFE